MKKIIALIIFIILGGLGYFAYDYIKNNLDNDVRNLIIEYGSEITGTQVNLDSVKLDLKQGIGSLNQFTLKNPKGFATDYAIKFNKAELDLEVDTVLSDVIVIEKFSIDGASINYEDMNGKTNFDQIKANVDQYLKAKKADEKTTALNNQSNEENTANSAEVKKEKRFIIKRFEILNTEAKATIPQLDNKEIRLQLPNIIMNNIGLKQNGLTAEQLSKVIIKQIEKTLIENSSFLNDIAKDLIIEYGSEITGTQVNLDSVKLDLKQGIGSLNQFTLKNPKGFATDYAIKFNKAELDLEVDTVLSDVIVIEKFSIDGASINYEDMNGKTNFDQIKANVDQYLKAKKADEKTTALNNQSNEENTANSAEVKKEKRFIIKRFEILNTEAKASMKLLGKRTVEVKLANIYLNNLGQSEGGLSSEKLTESIVDAIQDKLVASINFKNLAKELDKNIKEIKKDIKDVEKNIKNIKKRSKKIKNLEDLENITKDAESLFENLESLF